MANSTATYGPQGAANYFGTAPTARTATFGPQGAANYFGPARPAWWSTATFGPQGAANYYGLDPNKWIMGPDGTLIARAPAPPPVKAPTAAEIAARAARDAAAAQAAAQARADAEAAAAKKKAGQGYLERAGNLEGQIAALRHALGGEGFEAALNQNLSNILASHTAGIELLKEGHAARGRGFLGSAEDTEKATAQQAGSTFENLVRERQDTMANLLQQGAGETDALRAMVMAARNFRDNQSEGNRAYFDTMRTIGTGIADLNADTKTAMTSSTQALENERGRLWQDFYNRRSETYTMLGNTLGQQADYYISAEENDVSSGGKKGAAKTASDEAFMNAAREVGKSYVQQGAPQWLQEWKGIEAPQARQANTDLAAAVTFEPLEKAEGASLRGW